MPRHLPNAAHLSRTAIARVPPPRLLPGELHKQLFSLRAPWLKIIAWGLVCARKINAGNKNREEYLRVKLLHAALIMSMDRYPAEASQIG